MYGWKERERRINISRSLRWQAAILIHHGPRRPDLDIVERISAYRNERTANVIKGAPGDA